MNEPVRYGEDLKSEKMVNDNQVARDIVKEINRFGISERQRMLIVYLLGLELENNDHMRQITTLARELGKQQEMFLIDNVEEEELL